MNTLKPNPELAVERIDFQRRIDTFIQATLDQINHTITHPETNVAATLCLLEFNQVLQDKIKETANLTNTVNYMIDNPIEFTNPIVKPIYDSLCMKIYELIEELESFINLEVERLINSYFSSNDLSFEEKKQIIEQICFFNECLSIILKGSNLHNKVNQIIDENRQDFATFLNSSEIYKVPKLPFGLDESTELSDLSDELINKYIEVLQKKIDLQSLCLGTIEAYITVLHLSTISTQNQMQFMNTLSIELKQKLIDVAYALAKKNKKLITAMSKTQHSKFKSSLSKNTDLDERTKNSGGTSHKYFVIDLVSGMKKKSQNKTTFTYKDLDTHTVYLIETSNCSLGGNKIHLDNKIDDISKVIKQYLSIVYQWIQEHTYLTNRGCMPYSSFLQEHLEQNQIQLNQIIINIINYLN